MTSISDFGNWCPVTNNTADVFINNILHQGPGHTIPASLAGTSNKIITDLTNLYVGWPNNPSGLVLDARNQLAPNSPAKGAGEGGTDAGAFSGDDPYVLSGTPEIPSIYHLQVPATVSQGGTLQVQIKAKTNN